MLSENNVAGNGREVSKVLSWWNYFSVKSNGSKIKSIQFNKSIKLDVQDVRERTQRTERAFTLPVLSTFISLVHVACLYTYFAPCTSVHIILLRKFWKCTI